MSYKWEKNMIESLDSEIKDLLEKELNNEISKIDPSVSTYLSPSKFKRLYKTYLIYLKSVSSYIYKSQEKLIKTTLDTSLQTYRLPNQNITDEILIQIVLEFIKETKDKELIDTYNKLIDKNNHLLNIDSFSENIPLCNHIKGRHINYNGKQFVSIYTNGNIEDALLLSHEYGHFLASLLKRGPITYHFLKEFESFYLELLITDFISNTLDDSKLRDVLMSNKALSTQSDILLAAYYKEMNSLITSPTKEKLNKILQRKYNASTAITPPLEELYSDSFINDIKRLHSRLFAFSIYDLYKNDLEKAIYIYKRIIRSKIDIIDELYEIFNIDYSNYTNGYIKELKKTKEFALTLK